MECSSHFLEGFLKELQIFDLRISGEGSPRPSWAGAGA
ncbi:hypothetical protein LEP1GSC050_1976 [Leptospira broomii serovar Hurstbridge str. 5399]|uniref:Uncharacterized protein n=1 Tax=Leptospira broomii serovar Hurstbridge str. 5399 TaxID=1049789 RepID=T0FDP0_9LEPT|nr:hypothetical protein LEP1GSC050_1976 [Leptospira broomii serovar Hurstbridge str. 5399]